jgi:polynucleotide 5'-hydroxyl-kinase GRC3/NOL9
VAEIVVPAQWVRLSEEDLCGTVIVIGASDTGKSTLAGFLYKALCRRGSRTAFLDADVGQSTLGLPTTLNLAMGQGAGDDRFPPQGARASYFVGATTPRGHMLPVVVGTHRLQQEALGRGADCVVVDTSGLVDPAQGGKALKQWKVELLAPQVVIGLSRGPELEPILWPLRRDPRVRSVEIPVSPYVSRRSREVRIARRRERWERYLASAHERELDLRRYAVYDLERMAVGAVVAFLDARGLAVDLGVVRKVDRQRGAAVVLTPLASMEGVGSVRVGVERWDLESWRSRNHETQAA